MAAASVSGWPLLLATLAEPWTTLQSSSTMDAKVVTPVQPLPRAFTG